MPHKIYYWQPTNRKEGNLDGNLPERDVLFFLERLENAVDNAGGILVGERPVVGAQLEREGDALLAGGDAGSAVDIKEVDLAQELAGGSRDAALELAHGERFVADQRQIARDCREARQAVEDALFGKRGFDRREVEVRDIDLAADAVGFRDQRMNLTDGTGELAVNENVGAATGMIARVSRFATYSAGLTFRSCSSASISPFIVKKVSCSP